MPLEMPPTVFRAPWRLRVRVAERDGGGERDRTDDLLLAKQALSQLSYTPEIRGGSGWT